MSKYSPAKTGSVQSMFANIAERYDLINRLMTFGLDGSWRKRTIEKLGLGGKEMVLDIGCGTGDLAYEISKQAPESAVFASDFTFEMVRVGKQREGSEGLHWLVADAEAMPFEMAIFDSVVSGFLLRNVSNLGQALQEQKRLLVGTGRVATLDTSPPRNRVFGWAIELYFRYGIPLLGKWIGGDQEAYQYLPMSTKAFLQAEKLAKAFRDAGFIRVDFEKLMLGTIAIHWGEIGTLEK